MFEILQIKVDRNEKKKKRYLALLSVPFIYFDRKYPKNKTYNKKQSNGRGEGGARKPMKWRV